MPVKWEAMKNRRLAAHAIEINAKGKRITRGVLCGTHHTLAPATTYMLDRTEDIPNDKPCAKCLAIVHSISQRDSQ